MSVLQQLGYKTSESLAAQTKEFLLFTDSSAAFKYLFKLIKIMLQVVGDSLFFSLFLSFLWL